MNKNVNQLGEYDIFCIVCVGTKMAFLSNMFCVCMCVCTQLFSCVQLSEMEWIAAHQSLLSMEFSSQDY